MTHQVSHPVDWAVHDEGVGEPLLLLHGFTGTASAWDGHAAGFVGRYRTLIPCLPGHGTTIADAAAMTVEATADALAALLRERAAVPATVLGYSLGARVALRIAVEHPDVVSRLVLESPSAGLESAAERAQRRAADEALAARIERDGIDAFVAEWERHPIFASQAAIPSATAERVRAMRRSNSAAGLAASLRAAGQGAMEPLFDRLHGIAVPTLVIAGRLDATGLPRATLVADRIPGARLEIVEDAGHTPHDERPEAFRRLVLDFLEEDTPA
jgi:2-succinyl-6-hydroxy-2,4-cyclohexadiene-1-carboxylate synthase